MRELWRKTFELFRGNPILWLPYICTELTAFCLTKLRSLAFKGIHQWLLTRHSVLGGDIVSPNIDQSTIRKAVMLGAPLEWGVDFANVCLFTVALLFTSSLVLMLLREQRPDPAIALASLRAYPKRVLLFSLKFCLLVVLLTPLVLIPASYLPSTFEKLSHATSYLIYSGALLLMACVAWIMSPIAIRLLREKDSPAVSAEHKRWGRHSAILMVAAIMVLQYLVQRAEDIVRFKHGIQVTAATALATLIINFPVVLLFIALALIAAEDSFECERKVGKSIKSILRNLMPLHFGKGEDAEGN